MMIRRLALLAFAFCIFVTAAPLPADAAGNQYRCQKVDRVARLGTPPDAAVTWEEGDNDPETGGPYCAFSVDGYSVFGSPPFEKVKAALNILKSPDVVTMIQKNDVDAGLLADAFGWAISAAGRNKFISDELELSLKYGADRLSDCLISFYEGALKPGEQMTFEAGSCEERAAGSYNDFDLVTPMLEIRIATDGKLRRLFIPRAR